MPRRDRRRTFASVMHDDEVNPAMRDAELAARLMDEYRRDVGGSDGIMPARWRVHVLPVWESILGPFAWVPERQQ